MKVLVGQLAESTVNAAKTKIDALNKSFFAAVKTGLDKARTNADPINTALFAGPVSGKIKIPICKVYKTK